VYKILLVDDYEVNIEILEAYLSNSDIDAELYKAYDGSTALEIVAQNSIDLVLLDVMLPDIDGFQVCEKIKAQDNQLPIIMITALKDRDSVHKGLKAGANDFLVKPIDGQEVILRAKNFLVLRSLLLEQEARYRELREELLLAGSLQRSFLPKAKPILSGYDFLFEYWPSSFVGGDFFDFLPMQDKMGIFIADIKGHGTSSAMITALLKDKLYKFAHLWQNSGELLNALNLELCNFFSRVGSDYFITAFYGVLDKEGNFSYASAGQSVPCVLTKQSYFALKGSSGLPLGVLELAEYQQAEVTISEGEKIFLYTDGIFELELWNKDWHREVEMGAILEEKNINSQNFDLLLDELWKLGREYKVDDLNYIVITKEG